MAGTGCGLRVGALAHSAWFLLPQHIRPAVAWLLLVASPVCCLLGWVPPLSAGAFAQGRPMCGVHGAGGGDCTQRAPPEVQDTVGLLCKVQDTAGLLYKAC